jgi:hypothetical protein
MRGGTHEVGGPSSASRKWATTFVVACFLLFLLPSPTANACYTQAAPHHHLSRIQMRAGGGYCRRFYMTPTTTTSLASKHEPEVVFLVVSTRLPPPLPPSRSNVSRRWFFFVVSTCLPPPLPPSRPNASQRWFISFFQHASHHPHLPCVQARAGGGFFLCFDTAPTTTSLASECELEVVFFGASTRFPPPPPPSHPNASRRWSFSAVSKGCRKWRRGRAG